MKRPANRAREYGSLYKDYISWSASRPTGSRFDHNPNLYFMIYPDDEDGDEVLVAGGLYVPSSRQVRSIREAIAANATPFDRLFATRDFTASFPGGFSRERTATRPPRGFDPTHPRMDWLKLQAFFVWKSYKKREFASAAFPGLVARDFRQILRLNQLLEQAIQGRSPPQASAKKASSRRGRTLEDFEAPTREMDF